MSACPDKLAELHAYLDGELDPMNAQAFETHLKGCPDCAAALSELQGLRERMSDPGLREPAPAVLRQRIEAMIEAESTPARRRVPRLLPWALSGGLGAALAASLAVTMLLPATTTLETQLVDNHVRSTLAAHLVDVETSDRHTVKPWFNGKIDFAPPVVDLAPQGFPLVGGRVDYLQGRVVAALVYRRNKHVINLFIRPAQSGPRWPVSTAAHDGYSLIRWTEDGLEFWAVSDVEPKELVALRQAFRAQTGT
jgi:anti-sigma factor RsiW